LTSLLAKETPFNFDEDCLIAFYHSRSCAMQVTTPLAQCCVNARISSIIPYLMQVRH
jgi:hypothetical protein